MANDKFFRKVKRINKDAPKKRRRKRREKTLLFYKRIIKDIESEAKKGEKAMLESCAPYAHKHTAIRLFSMKNKGFDVIVSRACGYYDVLIEWDN